MRGPIAVDTPGEAPRRGGRGPVVVSIVLSVVAVAAIVFAGLSTGWFGIPELLGIQPEQRSITNKVMTLTPGEAGVEVRDSVGDYSWDELSSISGEISDAPSQAKAIEIAHGYNLCGSDGELAGMPSKAITLSNGTTLHASIIGFNHDLRENGTTAGITFLFDEVVSLGPWNQSGLNDGGWQASTARTWLSMTFFDTLPEDLRDVIVTVSKPTNNVGGVDSGSLAPSVVTVTPDKLWLPSHIELAGDDPEDVHWAISHYGTQYTWCNDITSCEGSQYALFRELGSGGFGANDELVRLYEGTARKWWMRSSNPHFSYVTLTVEEDGALDEDVGSIESQGMVPGFCV